jgi:solute carrier family 25 (mitochondrial phosphate transporter), member 23/24/25/41
LYIKLKIFLRTAPIDRLRVVFQVESVDAIVQKRTLSWSSTLNYILTEGSWHSLWRGNWVNVLKTAPEHAIRMATYEKFKTILKGNRETKINSSTEKFFCGSMAGLVSTFVLYPLKTVKTMMNLGKTGEFKSIIHCMNQMYTKYGIRCFYRGLVANSAAIMPCSGVDLLAYETLKKKYCSVTNAPSLTHFEVFILGNISSTLGNLIVYPLIFARTRLQSNRNPNETTLNLLQKVWKRDGLQGIYRGVTLQLIKIGPAAGISYIVFEEISKSFKVDALN